MSQKENAKKYLEQGTQFLHAENLGKALEFFSRAVELDPHCSEAYALRGKVFSQLGRTDEADADLRTVKSLTAGSQANDPVTGAKAVQKIDMKQVDSVFDDLTGDDELDFDDDLYASVFSDDTIESDNVLESLSETKTSLTGVAAILEYLDGHREEVPWTTLFEPTRDKLTLVFEEGGEPRVISLGQLSCIRLSRVPSGFPRNRDETCHVEVIETMDKNIFYESIHPVQDHSDILFGFSTKKDTRFKYTIIPRCNIKKRFQRRHLGQILLDRNLVDDDAFKMALDEHNELKKIKFGKLIASHAKILYSAVETEIQKAYQMPNQKKKIGEILLNAGLVTEEQIEKALEHQRRLKNRKLGNFLIEKGILQEEDLYMALAEKFRIPYVDLRKQKGSKKIIALLPPELIQKLIVLPLSVEDGKLIVATLLPDPSTICEMILRHSSFDEVTFVLARPSHLRNVINVLFQAKK